MSTVVADYIPGSQGSWDIHGPQVTRAFLVSGVSGDANARLKNAIMDAGVPAVGDVHPAWSGMYCYSKSATPCKDDPAAFVVTAVYHGATYQLWPSYSGAARMVIGSSVQNFQTTQDASGNQMWVQPSPAYSGQAAQLVVLSVQKPMYSIAYERLEPGDPSSKSQTYTGAVNSDVWKGGSVGTWMCTRLEGTTVDGVNYTVSYQFSYNPQSWTAVGAWRDSDGNVPPDAVDGAGLAGFQPYPTAAFAALNIP